VGWRGGGNLLAQLISTCLTSRRGSGGGGRHPVYFTAKTFVGNQNEHQGGGTGHGVITLPESVISVKTVPQCTFSNIPE
jgi:hypothetical protein